MGDKFVKLTHVDWEGFFDVMFFEIDFFFQFHYLTLYYWALRLVSFFNFSFHGVISMSYLISRFI
jgi:hypothetical protein